MKLFGEFLVEKGLISKEVLADALIEQLRGTPSYIELAWKMKSIQSDDVLKILKIQTETRAGFIEVLQQLKLWTPELQKSLLDQADSIRVPLGQILVNKGTLTLEAITHSLDEFLGDVKAPEKTQITENPSVDKKNNHDLFCETLNQDLEEKLKKLAERFGAGKDITANEVKDFFDGVHCVRGASRLGGENESEALCVTMEAALSILLKMSAYPEDLLQSLGRTAKAWVELEWRLRDALIKGAAEKDFFLDKEASEKKEKLMGLLEVLKFDAEMSSLSGGEQK